MTNQETVSELTKAQDTAMRVTARALIKAYHNDAHNNIEDFIEVLGWELSKHADDFARRTGDYDRAATLNIVADHLMKLDDVIDNYDPTVE
jgi:hypothetical protein